MKKKDMAVEKAIKWMKKNNWHFEDNESDKDLFKALQIVADEKDKKLRENLALAKKEIRENDKTYQFRPFDKTPSNQCKDIFRILDECLQIGDEK